jgi:acylglycerol lipase
MSDVTTPLYIVHSGGDTVTSPKSSERLHQVAGSTDKTLKIWPGAMHTDVFHGGPTQLELMEQGYDGVAAWIGARL